MYLAACFAVFALAYLLNILTITVGYHRGLAHKAVRLHLGLATINRACLIPRARPGVVAVPVPEMAEPLETEVRA